MEQKIHFKTVVILTALFCLTSLIAFPQTSFNWVMGMGGAATDQASAIDKDANGNIYAVGSFSGTANFGVNFTSAGTTNGFIVKMDPSGNYLWSKHLAGNSTARINDVKIDATGNIYMTGEFNAGADFDMGVGTASLTSASVATFILKLDPSGNYMWAKQFVSLPPSGSSNGNNIDCDASGNIYIAGEFNGAVDFNPGAATYSLTSNGSADVYIAKLDPSGIFLWARQFGGTSGDFMKSMYMDGVGNVYTTGSFQGTVDFDPGAGATIYTTNNTDIYISKLNSNGGFVYAKQIGGSGIDRGWSIYADPSGNSYTTGNFTNSVDFDPGVGTYSLTATAADIFVLKLDAAGNFSWADKFGTGVGIDISVYPSSDVFITGNYSGTSDFNPGPATFNLTSNGGGDIFIARLDNSGNFVSVLSMGGTGNDGGYDILPDGSGSIYLLGNYNATVDFNPFSGINTSTAFGGTDVYLLKLTDCSIPTAPVNTTTMSNQTICSGATAVITASSSGTVNWYSVPAGGVVLASGTSFTTPVLSAGVYTYYASAFTCTNSTSRTAITVTVNTSPVITVNSGAICSGNSFTITPSGAGTYTVSGGAFVVSPSVTSTYTVTGTSSNGCVGLSGAVSHVTVNPQPNVSVSTSNMLICNGQTATLSANGATTYTWNTNANTTVIAVSPTVTTTYTVSGTNAQGCSANAIITQSVDACMGIANNFSGPKANFIIYPNPGNGIFNIELQVSTPIHLTIIEVTDVLGRVILTDKVNAGDYQLNLSNQINGIYFVKTIVNGQGKVAKIIKE
ncbi:MAG: SBBP repeat-containing protein [Sediminibacterium sp.]|nr:SBBP repeat-containing protein [Sediminibacterium sp.]